MTTQPEKKIQSSLEKYMRARGWYVEHTHGNAFQRGFPDMYCIHIDHGQRWIDVKVPGRYSLTKAQRLKWPVWEANGASIWILTDASEEEYQKLFLPPNWREFWKASYGQIPDIDAILAQLNDLDSPYETDTWENE